MAASVRWVVWGIARAIVPVDPVEALALGVADPAMDGGLAHVELAGDLVLRSAPSDGGDDGPTAGGFPVSLLMVHSSQGGLVSDKPTPGAFRMLWHLAAEGIPPTTPQSKSYVIAITP